MTNIAMSWDTSGKYSLSIIDDTIRRYKYLQRIINPKNDRMFL